MSVLKRVSSILAAGVLIVAGVMPSTASAAGLPECNTGWSVAVRVVGGSSEPRAYVPGYYSSGGWSTRSCSRDEDGVPRPWRKEVERLQVGLYYSNAISSWDGYFGPGTRNALVNFQSASGLYPDGVYGPNTGSVMTWREIYGGAKGRWIW